MEKINIAKLLKDCPKGMELDCINYDGIVKFDRILDNDYYPIKISVKYGNEEGTRTLTKYGQTSNTPYNRCIIFPKGKTTWEGFQRPFKDGDILAYDKFAFPTIFIYRYDNPNWNTSYFVAVSGGHAGKLFSDASGALDSYNPNVRFATEEEKEKLFKAVKDNGFKWNSETKTLEKLVKPIFEVGNKIEKCGSRFTIAEVKDDYYLTECGNKISFENQDSFSLVPNKFDVINFEPFMKVLVKTENSDVWECDLFSSYHPNCSNRFHCVGSWYDVCIPYIGNEHLLNTTNDCDEFYKI